MRFIIDYIRSCFCKHDYEFIKESEVYLTENSSHPTYTKMYYRCKKCGYKKIYRHRGWEKNNV